MIDKDYCMSSYLAFRYIEKEDVDFKEGLYHSLIKSVPEDEKVLVETAEDIDVNIKKEFNKLSGQKLGIMLSGGMDSAILASYMPKCDAYTFRFTGGYQKDELERAEFYSDYYNLNLHYVDIEWDVVERNLKPIMESKAAPVHSIEPQIYQAALQAKQDNVECLIIGESADLIFGGMDGLLAKDWSMEEFIERYMFTNPKNVLKNPVSMDYLFEKYRYGDKIDFLTFLNDVFSTESASSYMNAFIAAKMPYKDPYAKLKMRDTLDLQRVRNGESKYLVRNLFAIKYPKYPIPTKVPMPRPVDVYFSDWKGPIRHEFIDNLDISKFNGNQKWQIYCLEQFLNLYYPL